MCEPAPITLVDLQTDRFALAQPFVISRGSKAEAVTISVTLGCDGYLGRGEAVPYARYGEDTTSVAAGIQSVASHLVDRDRLQDLLPPGAARNALDCALWDLEAKRTGKTAAALAGIAEMKPVLTAYTLSLAAPDEMAREAISRPDIAILKLKLGGEFRDAERMQAVRDARPDARLLADANEAWSPADLGELMAAADAAGLELIEQPLPAGDDAALAGLAARYPRIVLCADESVHARSDLAALTDRYSAVNIKLDKAGGLTEALLVMAEAARLGLKTMVGSMVASSLGIAPAMLLAQSADWVDLDSPMLLKDDRPHGLRVEGGRVLPARPELWG